MVKHGDYTEVILANPWRQGTILRRYALVDSSHGKTTIPEGLTRVVVPLRRCVVFTAAHMELFRLLGMTERVKGVADAGYMHQPWLPQAISKGLITDCGSSMSPNIEGDGHQAGCSMVVSLWRFQLWAAGAIGGSSH